MERQTRVNKYKELREEMKEEVAIDRQVILEENDDDDDFLAFIPRDKKPNVDDTLVEPLSYETLKKDNENVRTAIHLAKEKVGKDQYNTRLDILSKIKQEEMMAHHDIKEDIKEEPQKKVSLLEKLAAMSPEEDAEELRKYEEDMTVADLMNENKKKRRVQKEEVQDQEEPEKESKIITILNYIIVVCIIVFLVLAFFIVKQLFF